MLYCVQNTVVLVHKTGLKIGDKLDMSTHMHLPPAAAIELVALSKSFDQGPPAVDNISLRIPNASYCCLLGPSSCGKSTTLRMIAGHESVTTVVSFVVMGAALGLGSWLERRQQKGRPA